MHGQSGFSATRQRVALSVLAVYFIAIVAQSQAMPFHSKRKAQEKAAIEQLKTSQPPAANSLTVQCDPLRQDVILLSHKPVLIRPFYTPRRLYLMSKHRQCIDRLMDQEYLYLKNAKIQLTPKLPPMAMPLDLLNSPESNAVLPANSSALPSSTLQQAPAPPANNAVTGPTQEK
jgi:hypothetical protein